MSNPKSDNPFRNETKLVIHSSTFGFYRHTKPKQKPKRA